MKGLKKPKLLKFVAAMASSCGLLGVNPSTATADAPAKDKSSMHRLSDYNEGTFLSNANLGLKDLLNRVKMTKDNGKFKFSYTFVFAKERNVDCVNCEVTVDDFSEQSVGCALTHIFITGLSKLEKGYDVVLPSVDSMLFMVPEAQSLVNKWKNDGVYYSKISEMVKLYVEEIVKKHEKQLSKGKI